MVTGARAHLRAAAILLFCTAASLFAAPLDLQKIRLKGAQNIKDLRYFQETGLISARQTAIEMQIENYERSLTQFAEAKQTDRNTALKAIQANYEKFAPEFKAIADIYRDLALRHKNAINEKNSETISETAVREKVVATVEVAKQDETRALAAYTNRNYNYSAHLYWRSLRHYAKVFTLRKWQPLVQIAEKPKANKKPAAR
ncbi:hypothetical protein [Turneriella parva]|uniref:DUF5667 domain-containing protein n=1 Tax=Turneriella parva (strain ATCC BAA-1111 / DSM 21527 / NCTC 11395 / H) TaxID=869212 RepID=I4BBB6_TURPD|nr:hypothetical protein [Turneriella parva]AFM14573.1 hypothetical protein Turpa_3939 [Turneriella parva DSM 21527]